jgi:hypothetical protein
MFSGREDKLNLKEASLTGIQGFPENAANKSIYEIVSELKSKDESNKRRSVGAQGAEYVRRNERNDLEKQRTSVPKHSSDVEARQEAPISQTFVKTSNKFFVADKPESNFIQQT